MVNEKQQQLPYHESRVPQSKKGFPAARLACLAVIGLLVYSLFDVTPLVELSHQLTLSSNHNGLAPKAGAECAQMEPYKHTADLPELAEPPVADLARVLSGAVQVDTSTYDDWPKVDEDPERWEKTFAPFRAYLAKTFPKVHAGDKVSLELVHSHGLLYTWPGSEPDLKPLILMAHQDVVPVDADSLDLWTHPPFAGYYNETEGVIYGRGASDDKMSLVSILSSVESLLSTPFVPRRTIILAFGNDEESAGFGAAALSAHLVEKIGRNGAALIVDEGESVLGAEISAGEGGIGINVAALAVAEKGYLDVRVSVKTAGGHSSQPPAHTGIGYLAILIAKLESTPYEHTLDIDNPAFAYLLCTSDAPGTPARLRKALRSLKNQQSKLFSGFRSSRALEKAKKEVLAAMNDGQRLAYATSQAVDLIRGGSKINALPELATAVINHRISIDTPVAELRARIARVLRPEAQRLGLTLDAWGDQALSWHTETKSAGKIILEDAFESALEPAPRTPFVGPAAKPYRLLQSIVRATWTVDGPDGPEGIRTYATLMEGNTDTKSYWALTPHIFRFSPGSLRPNPSRSGSTKIHTVDENEQDDALRQAWRFYTNLIRAVSEVDNL